MLQLVDAIPTTTELPGLITASAMSVAIIQSMKHSNYPWFKFINQHSSGVNRAVGLVFAFGSGLGLHYSYEGVGGTLTITGLTVGALLAAVTHMTFHTAKSWSFNWIIYQLIKGRAAEVVAVSELPSKVKPTLSVTPGVAAEAAEVKDKS